MQPARVVEPEQPAEIEEFSIDRTAQPGRQHGLDPAGAPPPSELSTQLLVDPIVAIVVCEGAAPRKQDEHKQVRPKRAPVTSMLLSAKRLSKSIECNPILASFSRIFIGCRYHLMTKFLRSQTFARSPEPSHNEPVGRMALLGKLGKPSMLWHRRQNQVMFAGPPKESLLATALPIIRNA